MSRDLTLLSAFTIILVGFVLVGILFGFWNQTSEAPVETEQVEVVRIDYMHAQWCEYCSGTKEDLESIASELYPNMELLIWDEANRASDERTRQIYEDYKKDGLFSGFPTIISNGNEMLAGKTPRAQMKEWICSKFENRPAKCAD